MQVLYLTNNTYLVSKSQQLGSNVFVTFNSINNHEVEKRNEDNVTFKLG